jgi:tetratricopeptide (TPR) repeat protein
LALSLERAGSALSFQGHQTDALAAFRHSLELRERLLQDFPDDQDRLLDLATSHTVVGHVRGRQGDLPGARKSYERRVALCKQLVEKDPDNLKQQRELALGYEKVADAMFLQEEVREARVLYEKALEFYRRRTTADPTHPEAHSDLARVLTDLAYVYKQSGDVSGAEASLQESLAIVKRFAQLDPSNVGWQRAVLQNRNGLADLRQKDNLAQALQDQLTVVRELLNLAEDRTRRDPLNADWKLDFYGQKRQIALATTALVKQGVLPEKELAEAERQLQEDLPNLERLVQADPTSKRCADALSLAYLVIARNREAAKDKAGARDAEWKRFQAQLDFYQRWLQSEPDYPAWLEGLARAHWSRAVSGTYYGDFAASLADHRASLEMYERLLHIEPDSTRWLEKQAEALQWVRQALETSTVAAKGPVADVQSSPEYAEGLDLLRRSVAVWKRLVTLEPNVARWQERLADAYKELVGALRVRQKHDEANDAFAKRLSALQRFYELDPEAAKRDPFDRPSDPSISSAAILGLAQNPVHPQTQALLLEKVYRIAAHPSRAHDLFENYIKLALSVDLSKPAGGAEARWAVRRGLGLFHRLHESKQLHPVQERLIPFFEAQLKKLPPPEEPLEEPLQSMLDDLDYRRLGELLRKRDRLRDFVRILDQEAHAATPFPWARTLLDHLVVEALVLDPPLYSATLQTAETMLAADPQALGPEGRILLATLVRYGGESARVKDLAPDICAIPIDDTWQLFVLRDLEAAALYRTEARVLGEYLSSDPRRANSQFLPYLARAQMWTGQLEAAAVSLDKLRRLTPESPDVHFLEAQLSSSERRLAAAEDQLHKMQNDASLPPAWRPSVSLQLAWVQLERGEFDQAEAELKGLLAAYPNYSLAQSTLAYLYIDTGRDLDKAEALLNQAEAQAPSYYIFRVSRGALLVKQMRAKEGVEILEGLTSHEALADSPGFWQILGDAYLQAGRNDDARRAWRHALDLFAKTADPADRRKIALQEKLRQPEQPPRDNE